MGQRSKPKVPATVAAGTGLDAKEGYWYRVMARPGANTRAQASGGASNRYQMTTASKAPVLGITRCLLCS